MLNYLHRMRTHVVMYSLFLVATPFVMLQAFLQNAIGNLSRWTIPLAGFQIRMVPVAGSILAAIFLWLFRRHLTIIRLSGITVVILLDVLAWMLLKISSLLTDQEYSIIIALLTTGGFIVFFDVVFFPDG